MSTKPTVQDILKKLEALKPKITALASNVSTFSGTNLEQAVTVHNGILVVKQGLDGITPDVVNVQRPVSVPDGTQILTVLKEIYVICSALSSDAVAKRSLIDGLAVANSSALIKQDIKEISGSFVALASVLVETAPAEIAKDAMATRKEFDDAVNKVFVAYQ